MLYKKTPRIFISATKQNAGKTTISLGLCHAMKRRFKNIGFIKPVGQRYLVERGEKVDEDSVLMEKVCGVQCAIKDMSPVAVEKGFTRRYIMNSDKRSLVKRIKSSFDAVAKGKDLVIIEGTGHAGVGSVFDLSNATVAKMLGSKVIIVSSGGIGRPIDEIVLNRALFEKEGVEVAGAIVNKIMPEKYDAISEVIRMGLKRKGLKTLGIMPYNKILAEPSVGQILEELDLKLLTSRKNLDAIVGKILIGAMAPHDALNYLCDRSLIITPGDREDMILAVAGFQMDRDKEEGIRVAGIVLTGGIKPHRTVVDLVSRANIPMLLAEGDTYKVTSSIHDLIIKIKPEDTEKTKIVQDMIEKYVDIDALLK